VTDEVVARKCARTRCTAICKGKHALCDAHLREMADRQRRRVAKLKRMGLCTRAGCRRKARLGKTLCEPCCAAERKPCSVCGSPDHSSTKSLPGRPSHFALGLCAWCVEPSEIAFKGTRYCPTHAKERREDQKKKDEDFRKEARARGMCSKCSRRPIVPPSRSRCRVCRDYATKFERGKRQKKKAAAVTP
jgi:hypothetical protein